MSSTPYDPEYEERLRTIIREELEAERREVDARREGRWNWFWGAAGLLLFGPFAIAAAALLWVGAFMLDLGAKLIWAIRGRGVAPADGDD